MFCIAKWLIFSEPLVHVMTAGGFDPSLWQLISRFSPAIRVPGTAVICTLFGFTGKVEKIHQIILMYITYIGLCFKKKKSLQVDYFRKIIFQLDIYREIYNYIKMQNLSKKMKRCINNIDAQFPMCRLKTYILAKNQKRK